MPAPSMQEPTFFILAALASGEAHGYRLLGAVEELSEGRLRLRAGTLYGALDRLERDGDIELDRVESDGGPPLRPHHDAGAEAARARGGPTGGERHDRAGAAPDGHVMPGSAAVWIARRLPLDDEAHREELAGSIADLVAERPRCERARETASLVGLWLQLWGRREGLDDARGAVRQGLYLGGVLLAFVAAAATWGHGSVAATALATATAVLAAGGWRTEALAVSAASIAAATMTTGSPPAVACMAALGL